MPRTLKDSAGNVWHELNGFCSEQLDEMEVREFRRNLAKCLENGGDKRHVVRKLGGLVFVSEQGLVEVMPVAGNNDAKKKTRKRRRKPVPKGRRKVDRKDSNSNREQNAEDSATS